MSTKKNSSEETSAPVERMAFSLKETAGILGISYISANRLVKRGLIKSSSALRTKLISRDEIQRFLKATTEA